jgi:monofunctional biosynthetic peptidoglycan transglycosylase
MERNLSKQRILEIYLNTAEFGRGIYGVQAASMAYWGIPVSQISVAQAVELAATLPGPVKHNPASRSSYFVRHSKRIATLMGSRYTAPAESLDADMNTRPELPAAPEGPAPEEAMPAEPGSMDPPVQEQTAPVPESVAPTGVLRSI